MDTTNMGAHEGAQFPMNNDQFAYLAQLLRLRGGAAQEVARLTLVEGLSVPLAAERAGLDLRSAYFAEKRAREGYELAKRVCGIE